MKKKKILILGSNSQLSKCLFKNRNKKYDYSLLDRKKLDITNLQKTKNFIDKIKPLIIINCIAYTDVDNAEINQNSAKKSNILGIQNIVKIIKKTDILLIHFSTDYVFDGKKEISYNEDDLPNPLSVYGKTKLAGDLHIINNYNYYLIFRISWLYSEFNNNFLISFINLIKKKSRLSIISNNKGRPTNANNLSKFVYIAIEKTLNNRRLSGIYNYSDSGTNTSWFRLINFIYSQMKFKGIKVPDLDQINQNLFKSKAERPLNSSLNLRKIYYKFKFKPNYWKKNILNEINKIIVK